MGRRTLVTPAGPLVRGAANGGAAEPRTAGACRPSGRSNSPGVGVGGRARVRVLGVEDVLVLDRDLPRVHGDQVCRRLASQGASTRIMMLTAAGAVEDRVQGLELGADDYLGKPFAVSELVARVRALGRRSDQPTP